MHVYILYTNTPWATLRPFLFEPTPNGSFDFSQLRVKSQLAGPGIGKTNDCMNAGDDDTLRRCQLLVLFAVRLVIAQTWLISMTPARAHKQSHR
jgi:hypothetical protein